MTPEQKIASWGVFYVIAVLALVFFGLALYKGEFGSVHTTSAFYGRFDVHKHGQVGYINFYDALDTLSCKRFFVVDGKGTSVVFLETDRACQRRKR